MLKRFREIVGEWFGKAGAPLTTAAPKIVWSSDATAMLAEALSRDDLPHFLQAIDDGGHLWAHPATLEMGKGDGSLLHHAIERDRVAMVEALIAHGLLGFDRPYEWIKPLEAAALAEPSFAMFQLLVHAGENLEAKCFWSETPLLVAALQARARSASHLLALGANPHVQTSEGENALQLLVEHCYLDHGHEKDLTGTLQVLLDYGVDALTRNGKGNAIGEQCFHGGEVMKPLLIRLGAHAAEAATKTLPQFLVTPDLGRAGYFLEENGRPKPALGRLLAFGHLPTMLAPEHWKDAPVEAAKIWEAAGPYYRRKHQQIDLTYVAVAKHDAAQPVWQERAQKRMETLPEPPRR